MNEALQTRFTVHQSPSVMVEKIVLKHCCLCADMGKTRKATHEIRLIHYFSYLGLVAAGEYCQSHANQMADEFRKQMITLAPKSP